ncbi:PAS domain S-box protein [Verrucomicrobiota bacterium sgz303538]
MSPSAVLASEESGGLGELFIRYPQPAWAFDVTTFRVLAANHAAGQKYGYSEQEFLSLSAEKLFAPQELPQFDSLLQRLRNQGSLNTEERVPRIHQGKGGQVYEWETSWTPVMLKGQPAILVSVHDSHESKKAKQHSREQSDFLDLAADAILVCDLNGRIVFWNQGAARLYGWSKDEAIGKPMEILMGDTAVLAAVEDGVREDGEWRGELHQVTKTGQELIVNSRWTLVRDEQGAPKSVLVINTDLTETKRLETQFLRAQRLESVGTLASGIAHDLNNILSPILMSVGLLRRSMNSPDEERMLGMIESSAERGAEIVKQVLTFARGVEGERVLLQPKHLIGEIVKILVQTFPRNIDLQPQYPADLWTVTGDATQLHQVLLNLCVNARDAMPKGGVLTIAAENIEVDQNFARMNAGAQLGDHVVLRVTDTGVGMTPETMDKIFEPFFTTKDVGKGTGLGLATVLGIVKSHGGFLTVQSKVEHGTTFRIFIPATRHVSEGGGQNGASTVVRGRGELVLVVDDEMPIREALVQTLQDHGYRAYTAEDGSDALALYVQRPGEIDVVLTDLAMGLMDGLALVRSLRRFDPKARVIVSSGHCDTEQSSLLASLGVRTFLDKPYNAAKLLRALRETLDGK